MKVQLTLGEVLDLAHLFRQMVMHPEYDGSDGRVRSSIYSVLSVAAKSKGCAYISDERVDEPGWYGPKCADYSEVLELDFEPEHLGAADLISRNTAFLVRERDPEQSRRLLAAAAKLSGALTARGYVFLNGEGWKLPA